MPEAFPSRFAQVAEEFERYRPDYPALLFERILAEIPAERRGRAMDLGAGTGKSTRALVEHFAEVIAVEPDPGMAAKLARQVPGAIVWNVTAEDCRQEDAAVDLITIGNAFHWMEAERIFANARRWLRREGMLAIFDRPLPKATPAIDAIVLAELRGPWKPHRDPRLGRARSWEDQVRHAPGFRILGEGKFPRLIPMPAAEFAGFWRSTSYGSAYARTLADPEGYWQELESRFARAAAGDIIPVDLTSTLILARKE